MRGAAESAGTGMEDGIEAASASLLFQAAAFGMYGDSYSSGSRRIASLDLCFRPRRAVLHTRTAH